MTSIFWKSLVFTQRRVNDYGGFDCEFSGSVKTCRISELNAAQKQAIGDSIVERKDVFISLPTGMIRWIVCLLSLPTVKSVCEQSLCTEVPDLWLAQHRSSYWCIKLYALFWILAVRNLGSDNAFSHRRSDQSGDTVQTPNQFAFGVFAFVIISDYMQEEEVHCFLALTKCCFTGLRSDETYEQNIALTCCKVLDHWSLCHPFHSKLTSTILPDLLLQILTHDPFEFYPDGRSSV